LSADRTLWLGIACGTACAAIWGVQAVVSRQSVIDGLTALDVVSLRFVVASLLLLPAALRRRPFPVGPLGWRRAVIVTLLAGASYSVLLVGGIAFTPALHGAVVAQGLIPVFATLIGLLFLGDRPRAGKLGCLALVLAGIALFGWEGFVGTANEGAWRGHLLFALGAVMWAGFGALTTRWRLHPVATTATVSILSLPMLPVFALVLPMHLTRVGIGPILLQTLYQGVAVGVVSLVLYSRTVALVGPVGASMFITLVPVTACLAAIPVLGEWPTGFELAGMTAVIAGLMLSFLPAVRGRPAAVGAIGPESR
jgi:drug/metabolite transporter (DMT)-like permease